MPARTTDQTTADDPLLGLIAKRKAEALARAEKEHSQLAAAARLWAQGSKTVHDAEENLRKGRDKQDAAIAAMLGAGMDAAQVAETLGITAKAVTEASKRHRSTTEGPAPEKPAKKAATRAPRAKAVEPEAENDTEAEAAAEDEPPAETVAEAGSDTPPEPTDTEADTETNTPDAVPA